MAQLLHKLQEVLIWCGRAWSQFYFLAMWEPGKVPIHRQWQGTAMAIYRAYFLTGSDHINSPPAFLSCDSDEEAIQQARPQRNGPPQGWRVP
jgi:hypothetical protein